MTMKIWAGTPNGPTYWKWVIVAINIPVQNILKVYIYYIRSKIFLLGLNFWEILDCWQWCHQNLCVSHVATLRSENCPYLMTCQSSWRQAGQTRPLSPRARNAWSAGTPPPAYVVNPSLQRVCQSDWISLLSWSPGTWLFLCSLRISEMKLLSTMVHTMYKSIKQ